MPYKKLQFYNIYLNHIWLTINTTKNLSNVSARTTLVSSAGQLFWPWPSDSGYQPIISPCDSWSHINTRLQHLIVTATSRQLITSPFGAQLTAQRLKCLSTDWNVNLVDGIWVQVSRGNPFFSQRLRQGVCVCVWGGLMTFCERFMGLVRWPDCNMTQQHWSWSSISNFNDGYLL